MTHDEWLAAQPEHIRQAYKDEPFCPPPSMADYRRKGNISLAVPIIAGVVVSAIGGIEAGIIVFALCFGWQCVKNLAKSL